MKPPGRGRPGPGSCAAQCGQARTLEGRAKACVVGDMARYHWPRLHGADLDLDTGSLA